MFGGDKVVEMVVEVMAKVVSQGGDGGVGDGGVGDGGVGSDGNGVG